MISQSQAELIKQKDYPALAGYLLDGQISELDIIAATLKMIQDRVLKAEFENNDIRGKIKRIIKNNVLPSNPFDNLLLKMLFEDNQSMDAVSLGKKISSEDFKLAATSGFEILLGVKKSQERLQYKVGDRYYDFVFGSSDVNPFRHYSRNIKQTRWGLLLTLPILLFIFIQSYFELGRVDMTAYMFEIAFLLAFSVLQIYSVFFAKHSVKIDFTNASQVESLKQEYKSLYEFLNKYPLEPHNFTNMFLPFSVAFGLDQSWNADFGLGKFHGFVFN